MSSNTVPPKKKQSNPLVERAKEAANAKFWQPVEIYDSIEGDVVRITKGSRYDNILYHVKTANDGILIVAGGETNRGKKLAEYQTALHDHVGIVFLGEGTSRDGKKFKDWYVEVKKPDQSEPPDDSDIPF